MSYYINTGDAKRDPALENYPYCVVDTASNLKKELLLSEARNILQPQSEAFDPLALSKPAP